MKKVRLAACAVALSVGGLSPLGLSPAAADPASTAGARAYGANLNLAGNPVIDRAGLAESVLPPGGDDVSDLLLVPVEPVAVDGAARGQATTSAASTIPSLLDEQVQPVPGPYNTRAVGQVDDLAVLLAVPTAVQGVNLELATISADAVRAEAVGVCRNGQAVYSAQSEQVNLEINNEPLGLDAPVTDLLGAINDLLEPLNAVADIELNQVAPLPGGGIQVDALVVTVLGAVGTVDPLVELRIGHAEVAGLQCPPANRPQCSDTEDNDGDGKIDANDPGCINNGVYDPNDDDERDLPRTTQQPPDGALPRTGGDSSTTLPIAGGFAALALGALVLRRRSQASS